MKYYKLKEKQPSIFFVIKGALYQHDIKGENDLNIIDLHIENERFLNHKSFITQKPSDTAISAFTDGMVLEVNIGDLWQKRNLFRMLNT